MVSSAAICEVERCGGAHYARDWCEAHYRRWRTTGDVQAGVPVHRRIMGDDHERFWAKVTKQPDDGCWLWAGALSPAGYGRFDVGSRNVRAHRWAYEEERGPIPEGLSLDHLCRTRRCVRPGHLEPVTQRENVLRGEGFAAVNARKTHCPRGHPLSGENLYRNHRGWRQCRACNRRKVPA